MVKVCYITTVDRNPGDTFIQYGIDSLMRQVIPLFEAHYVDKHDLRSRDVNWWYLQSHPRHIRRFLSWWLKAWRSNVDTVVSSDVLVQSGTPFLYRVKPGDPVLKDGGDSSTTDWIKTIWGADLDKYEASKLLLLMGVGTCQAYHSEGLEFEEDFHLKAFIKRLFQRANLAIVRDPLAEKILTRMGIAVQLLPCPALFAGDLRPIPAMPPGIVVLNYMRGAGHYELGQAIDNKKWENEFQAIYATLSRDYRCVVACHAAKEALEARRIVPDADIFFRSCAEDYLRLYSSARFAVVNRVHAAVAMAGYGRPSVVVGSDTRAHMAHVLGLPTYFVNEASHDVVLQNVQSFVSQPEAWSVRLTQIKTEARKSYTRLLSSCLAVPLASVSAMDSYSRTDYSYNKS